MGARFLTRDPLSAVSRDPYSYAWNNPINYADPSGQFGIPILAAMAVFEIGSALWDAYDARTFSDDCSGSAARWFSGGALLAGVLLPGARYGSLDEAADAGRGLWRITQEGTERTARHRTWGTFSKSASDGTWWVRDRAGHGGSVWKVYTETSTGLRWRADADQYGTFIQGKHIEPDRRIRLLEGPVGMIHNATEFIYLRESTVPEEYTRAATEDAPLEVWLELVQSHPDMRFWVAQNKTVPTEILEILAGDDDARVRSMVASKRKASRELLTRLAADPDDSVRHSVARNPAAPPEALRLLAADSWETIRRAAAERMGGS